MVEISGGNQPIRSLCELIGPLLIQSTLIHKEHRIPENAANTSKKGLKDTQISF